MAVSFDIVRTTVFYTDGGEAAVADPGDVLKTTVTITNTGDQNATNTTFNDTFFGSTLTGSVNISPIAFNDAFTAVGNTVLRVGGAANIGTGPSSQVSGNLLTNDAGSSTTGTGAITGDGVAGFQLDTVTNGVSAGGGTFNVFADGSFNYVNQAGDTGTDTFTYTIRDAGLDTIAGNADDLTSTATVTITLSGEVWYVDSAAAPGGTGTSANPFNSMTVLNGVTGDGTTNDDVDGSGDYIYIKGNAPGSIVLETGQLLVGGGTELNVSSFSLAAAGTNSDITGSSGFTVTLAGAGTGNNTITGIDINGVGGITGTSFGTVTVNNSTIDTTGQALLLNTGAFAGGGFTSTDSDGGTNNVALTSVTGTVNLGSGALSGATGNAVLISGGAGSVDYNGSVAHTGNAVAINVTGKTGGTVQFDGTVSSTVSSDGISLSNNTGATINFTNTLTLDTDASSGSVSFNATGGGTVSVTGSANTISSAGAAGVNIQNTTIGASGVTFRSVSASGGTNGIVLNNTGSGGFTITGTDGADAGTDPDAGTGGTIQTSTGDGIDLNNASNVNLGGVTISNVSGNGIDAANLGGVNTFNVLNVLNWGQDLTDTKNGVNLVNLNTNMTSLVVTNSTFNGTNDSNDGLFMEAQGTSNMSLRVEGSTFTDIFGDGVEVQSITGSTGTVNVRVWDNIFTNAAVLGNGGVQMDPFGAATFFIDIDGNTFTDIMRPVTNLGAIGMTSGLTATVDMTIRNNVMSDIEGARGITATVDGGHTELLIDNNTINSLGSTSKFAISVNSTNSISAATVGNVDVTISNNDIGQSGNLWTAGNGTAEAIFVTNQGGATIDALITNNLVTANGSLEIIRGRAAGTGVMNITMTNNTVTDTVGSHLELALATGTVGTQPAATINASISGNLLAGGATGTITLTEGATFSSGTPDINMQQASAAALTAANNGATVSPDTSDFGQAAPTLPTTPTLPSQPILAATTPAPTPTEPDVADGSDSGGGAGEPAGPTVVDDGTLSQAELDLIVGAAIARWEAAGATDAQLAAMRATQVSVSDLGGLTLGESNAGTIVVDDNAAGWRWFVDTTPGDDAEYAGDGTVLTASDPYGEAGTRMDLLTVVMHELGHQVGLEDTFATGATDELMYGMVSAGQRRLPGSDDLSAATGIAVDGALAISPINLGTLPAGQTVTVQWLHTIDTPAEDGLVGGGGQAFVDSDQTAAVGSLFEIVAVDGLTLGDTVFFDANNNGAFDAGDTGISGVTLALYADTNNNGVYDAGTDLYIGYNELGGGAGYQQGIDTPAAPGTGTALTTTTNGSGVYSFNFLAPGDYIVVIPATNFAAAAPLDGRSSATGGADPDDNVDNDDNGVPGAGGAVVSQAIRLDYNSEPTAGPGNDTNSTLDFGFIHLNVPPVNTVPGTQTMNEDATLTFTGGTAISVSDSDVGAGNLTVTVGVVNGQLTLSGTAGLAFSTGDGTDDTTMTFSGTQAAINAALNGLVYEPTRDFNGSDTLTIVTNDNGNTGVDPGTSGGASDEQDSDSVTINITAVADATNDTPTVNEDSGANILDLLANDSFENPGRSITAVGAALHGTTSINNNGTALDTTDDFVVYTPNANFNGSDSFAYTVTSGGVTEQATATVAITSVNDAPTVAGDGTEEAATIVEDSPSSGGQTVTSLFSGQYSDATDAQFSVGNPTGSSPGAFSGIAVVANGSSASTGQWQYFNTGTSTWVDIGAVATNNALLIGAGTSIRFNPAPDFNGTAPTLTAHLIDNSLAFAITFGQHADLSGVGATGGTSAYSTATVVLSQTVTPDGFTEGTSGDDTIIGTPLVDVFLLQQGGNDTVTGLASNDGFYFGGAFTAADSVDGGDGTLDQVGLQGDYSAGLTFGANSFVNVEMLVLLPGDDTRFGDPGTNFYDYNLTTVDANVAAGQLFVVSFNTLRAGEDVTFDGSAETDGAFLTYGGMGTDDLTGGAGDDGFYFGGGRFGAGDTVDGGAGTMDQLGLQGDYAIVFGAGQLTGIEAIVCLSADDARFNGNAAELYNYDLTMNEGNVANGGVLVISANQLIAGETLAFNASAETDGGRYIVYSGTGNDTIVGSAGADELYGAAGADTLTGGGGNDKFFFTSAAHSTTGSQDHITDFTFGDLIDLAAIDANSVSGGDQAFSFVGSNAFSNTAGELRATLQSGSWLVQGDTNGDGVADFSLLVTPADADPFTAGDFIL
jgi:hypothetical protein